MKEEFSPVAQGIIDGLQEVLEDVRAPQSTLKKTVVYRVDPRELREHLHMSQQKFGSIIFSVG